MESSPSFNLTATIQQWRDRLAGSPALGSRDLDELESHLRDAMAQLMHAGLNEEEAFLIGARRLGDPNALRGEFEKSKPVAVWLTRLLWALSGLLLLQLVVPLCRVAGFSAFVVARGLLPTGQVHLVRIIGITVLLGAGAALLGGLWRCRLRFRPGATWLARRLLRRPVLVAVVMTVLLETLHAVDAAISRTSTYGLHAPSTTDRSLLALVFSVKGLIQHLATGHRPYGTGQAVYVLLQHLPELTLIGAFVYVACRVVREATGDASLSREP